MRSHISNIITEIFLQHFENMNIKQILDKKSYYNTQTTKTTSYSYTTQKEFTQTLSIHT